MESTNVEPKTEPQPTAAPASVSQTQVVIMGAGAVGLATALQLQKRGIQVTIIDRLDNKKKYYKVGESLLIFSNTFLRTVGGIRDFLHTSAPKFGIWNTYDMEYKQSFDGRPEFSFIGSNPPQKWIDSFVSNAFYEATALDQQISRPEAEALLVEVARQRGIQVISNGFVKEIKISPDGGRHTVRWEPEGQQVSHEISCQWVIDCAGRKRILAKQMGHVAEEKEFNDGFRSSSVWGHFKDVPEEKWTAWKAQFTDGSFVERDKFTCHLWGKGYWIWVIRLNEDRLSLGICFDKKTQIAGNNYQEMFWDVIRRYPVFKEIATEENMIQFASYKDMQYCADGVINEKRYAMIGDSAASIDAFYSQGMSISFMLSWHICNVIQDDLQHNTMDRGYLSQINEHAVSDWHMIRSTVKYKYTKAIEDSRFFVLSHFTDLLMLSAATVPRHLLVRWLLETDSGSKEGPVGREQRKKLSRRLYFSAAYPYLSLFGPRRVAKMLYAIQEGLANRAIWRIENGVKVPQYRFIYRFLAKLPRLYKLFGAPKPEEFIDITPDLMPSDNAPKFMHITGRENVPISLFIGTRIFFPMMVVGTHIFDWVDTSLWKLRLKFRGGGAKVESKTS